MNIEFHINELVLEGFTDVDHRQVRNAIKIELMRLMAEKGAPPFIQSGDYRRLNGGAIQVTPGAHSSGIGAQVARAVYGGLTTFGATQR